MTAVVHERSSDKFIEFPVSEVQQPLGSLPVECPVWVSAASLTVESKCLQTAYQRRFDLPLLIARSHDWYCLANIMQRRSDDWLKTSRLETQPLLR